MARGGQQAQRRSGPARELGAHFLADVDVLFAPHNTYRGLQARQQRLERILVPREVRVVVRERVGRRQRPVLPAACKIGPVLRIQRIARALRQSTCERVLQNLVARGIEGTTHGFGRCGFL
ncbi:hypothetical protein D3C72_1030320 [compost metagenome]